MHTMRVLAGILGVIVGFVVGVVLTEVVFPNNQDWPIVVPFALAVAGWLAARAWLRRIRAGHDDVPDKASTT
jgi:positive regulator of sigma E activity